MATLEQRVKELKKTTPTKSGIARALVLEGFTLADIARAVPMNYSQVHSVSKTVGGAKPKETPKAKSKSASDWGQTSRAPGKRTTKPVKSPVLDAIRKGKPVDIGRISGRVGKLRVPGLPSDTDVGECVNCGHDLVIRNTGPGVHFTFVHVNISTEDHLNVTQFCHGVPKVLIG